MKKLAITTLLIVFPIQLIAAVYFFSGSEDIESDHISFYLDLDAGKKLFLGQKSTLFFPSFFKDSLQELLNNSSSEFYGFNAKLAPKSILSKLRLLNGRNSTLSNLIDASKNASKGDNVHTFYFTDHGNYNADTGQYSISSADGDLYTSDLNKLQQSIHKSNSDANVIYIQDHCFGAGHLSLIYVEPTDKYRVKKGVCAFASASSNEASLSDESMMQFFSNVLAKNMNSIRSADQNKDNSISYREAFDGYKQWFSDKNFMGRSTPMSSTDQFLNNLFDQQGTKKKEHCNISDVLTTYCKSESGVAEDLSTNFSLLYLDQVIARINDGLQKSLDKFGINKKVITLVRLDQMKAQALLQDELIMDQKFSVESSLMSLQNDLFDIIGNYTEGRDNFDQIIDQTIELIDGLPPIETQFVKKIEQLLGPNDGSKINNEVMGKVSSVYNKYLSGVSKLDILHVEARRNSVRRSTIDAARRDLKSMLMLSSIKDQLQSDNPKERQRANTAVESLTRLDECEGQEFIKR